MTMTIAQARAAGYEINRGSYQGTTDDRLDRWYIEATNSKVVDRRGPGFATRKAALDHLSQVIEARDT